MSHNRRAKNSRLRGSHTHGWGSKKKHRGSGHRGGKGNAGSGKRGDSKKPSYWGIKNYYGKHGFHTHSRTADTHPINLEDLQLRLESFVALGLAKKSADSYELVLSELGYNKLLGSGTVTSKLKIKVDYASKSAVQKIKEKGGEVLLLKEKIEKKKEQKSETE